MAPLAPMKLHRRAAVTPGPLLYGLGPPPPLTSVAGEVSTSLLLLSLRITGCSARLARTTLPSLEGRDGPNLSRTERIRRPAGTHGVDGISNTVPTFWSAQPRSGRAAPSSGRPPWLPNPRPQSSLIRIQEPHHIASDWRGWLGALEEKGADRCAGLAAGVSLGARTKRRRDVGGRLRRTRMISDGATGSDQD